MDLATGKYWPYRKPNSDLQYIHAQSNHPPAIIKQLPAAIYSRISSLSCNKEEFDRAIPAYKEALEKSGHRPPAQSTKPAGSNKRKRSRKITWFNPPYNQNVTTNVAGSFLRLVDKHFPRHHPYSKLFNRDNLKCSYSCMQNMGAIISAHNTKVLTSSTAATPPARTCNCRKPLECPLNGNCLAKCLVYKATVTAPTKSTKHYYGLTEGEFKTRYNLHTRSFRDDTEAQTELSKYIWELKRSTPPLSANIRWEIIKHAAPYRCGSRRCDLCLTEKMVIAAADTSSTLNKRSEIMSTCRHRKKFSCEKVSLLT